MKVYVVSSGVLSEHSPRAVFSTLEAAKLDQPANDWEEHEMLNEARAVIPTWTSMNAFTVIEEFEVEGPKVILVQALQ